jgi:hypothetical protein
MAIILNLATVPLLRSKQKHEKRKKLYDTSKTHNNNNNKNKNKDTFDVMII